jgi:hypothetical protein
MKADMKTLTDRLGRFFEWFFNASPVWVDERSLLRETPSAERRAGSGRSDRRRGDERAIRFPASRSDES